MSNNVKAIFFDIGGTLRLRVKDKELRRTALDEMLDLLGLKEEPEDFHIRLSERFLSYKKWAQVTMIEASEEEIWTRWILPEYSSGQIKPLVKKLDLLWRKTQGRRVLRHHARKVLAELEKRGYILSVISNTSSPDNVPKALKEYKLDKYFSTVILSSTFGKRKPNPEIFLEATQRAGVEPQYTAYVGDLPSRDVDGPKVAGFAMSILIDNHGSLNGKRSDSLYKPDVVITELTELLNIFKPINY